jgi:hypothetical protein
MKLKIGADGAVLSVESVPVMDLPDQVTMSAGPVPVEPEATSTKGSH